VSGRPPAPFPIDDRPSPAGTDPAGRRPAASGPGGEEGVTSLELAILYPVVLLILLGMFQISLYWHAANTAEAAAARGVEVGKVDHGDEGAAIAEATEAAGRFLASATRVRNPDIQARVENDRIIVTVATDAPRLFGPGTWRVRSEAEGRLERFVPADER
jgi:hypothetical protein